MPKIIENLREKLLAEAKRQIEERGYADTTVRSIAKACGVGTGTVYNYFPSKDMLIASFMVEDWQRCLAKMRSFPVEDRRAFLGNISACLNEFISAHAALFGDKTAFGPFTTGFAERHKLLRAQVADVIMPLCSGQADDERYLAEFTAESILTWTITGRSFGEQYALLERLFIRP